MQVAFYKIFSVSDENGAEDLFALGDDGWLYHFKADGSTDEWFRHSPLPKCEFREGKSVQIFADGSYGDV